MRPLFRIEIPGDPKGKARPRMTRKGFVYTPKSTAQWEAVARMFMKEDFKATKIVLDGEEYKGPLEVPVRVLVTAVKKRPKRLLRKKDPDGRMWCTAKPDWDNVGKIVSDALVKAGVLRDDTYVVDGRVLTYYASRIEGPVVEIEVFEAAKGVPWVK
jgi:Holliday junction resolvase RusA-like endonuclease